MTLSLEYEMTFAERIDGPWGPTIGSPARLCWTIVEASLTGSRVSAQLAAPGIDWIRLDPSGNRRQDQRIQFVTADGAVILMRYDSALIRADDQFSQSLADGRETTFDEHYLRMVPQFEVDSERYSWLTDSLFLGRGRLAGSRRIEYEIYRVG